MATAGYSGREIARALGYSHTSVARVLQSVPPLERSPVTIQASRDGTVTVHTAGDPRLVGVAVKRALERAGWTVRNGAVADDAAP